jgi:hypothetical protein
MRKACTTAFLVLVATGCGTSGSGSAGPSGTGANGGGGTGNTSGTAGASSGGTGAGLNLDSGTGDSGTDAAVKCTPGTKDCNGLVPQFCEADGTWTPDTPCPFACTAGTCTGSCVPGTDSCVNGYTKTCQSDAEWGAKTACEFGCDTTGKCKTGCTAGEFHCNGNEVQQCDPGPPSKWVAKSPATTCNANAGQLCDAATGTCLACSNTGGTTPTGDYYQYAIFQTGSSAFLGGYDVSSFGDYIYVNRGSANIDVYKVTLLDTDGDGKLEPNQHPNNPNDTGPMEQRQLDFVQTFTKSADGAPSGPSSTASLLALSNAEIYSLGPTKNGSITLYDFTSKASTVPVQPATTAPAPSFFGFGADTKTWFAGNESARRVYYFNDPNKQWAVAFCYPDLAGSHMDGMDVVVSPKTGIEYVYVSDMTSDFIAQYKRDDTQPGGWVQNALFKYADATSSSLEGFGFGALKHFWATSGTYLYELGGGDLQDDIEPCPNGKQSCGGSQPACGGTDLCVGGCCSPNPCQNGEQYCGGGASCQAGYVCTNSCCVSQCPVGKTPCGTGLPACPTGNSCQGGCCVTIG